jgi:hypothetical protein
VEKGPKHGSPDWSADRGAKRSTTEASRDRALRAVTSAGELVYTVSASNMSLDRAKTLLASTDATDNRNGVALVINAAATCALLNNYPVVLEVSEFCHREAGALWATPCSILPSCLTLVSSC